MGYYDGDHEYSSRQKGNRGGKFLPALLGAILGGLLVLFTVPALGGAGLLPDNLYSSNGEKDGLGTDENIEKRRIDVDLTTNVTEAVDKASGAVVEVINIQQTDFWSQQPAGTGSGVIYKKEGNKAYVVTNDHVVADASQLEITLSNGTKLKGKLRGTDPLMDLAVVEIDGSKVTDVAEFGVSGDLKRGEPAIAIGNPLGNFPGSVTQGIVSSADRSIPVDIDQDGNPDWQVEVIQTDAAINPGNSGGALINIAGQVIGINSSKIAQQEVEGIGFAIPSDVAKPIIEDLEKFGEVRRPFLGVNIIPLSQVNTYHREQTLKIPKSVKGGIVVMEITPTSPAARAGIKEMDVIVEIDGEKMNDPIALRKFLYTKTKIGDEVEVVYYRDGKKKTTKVELGKQT
ncbi:S1C family serine protease [Fictibacillus phosphorivorans]|uniref:S1C family serine protease n=1 Tax=Fictibacillus phosphorivorans TaxID=1221500 RepID=UPI0020408D58|nr:S1C family serine protease [Fictibacillus phosphorivorans]MCM3719532.1 S1C family serine protease [Fictibacillus phosphorivorans]MCM3777223.1 S1C family serine protease [Fictibacillus phosphorivorans]